MITFESWFRSFFSQNIGGESSSELPIENRRDYTWFLWIFGSVLYISFFLWLMWLMGFTSSSFQRTIKNQNVFYRLFFLVHPQLIKEYFISSNGIFKGFRDASGAGESIFIFFFLASWILFITIIIPINISLIVLSKKKNKPHISYVAWPLFLPGSGILIAGIVIAHLEVMRNRNFLKKYSKNKWFREYLMRYIEYWEIKEKKSIEYKPKNSKFLKIKSISHYLSLVHQKILNLLN